MNNLNQRKFKTLSQEKQKSIRNAFTLFDTNDDNYLDPHEIKAAIRALGLRIKKTEVIKIMETYDKLKHNKICYEDFYYIVSDKMLRSDPLEEIKYAFQLFVDGKSDSTIEFHDLKRVSELIAADLTDEELRGMIYEFDTKEEGKTLSWTGRQSLGVPF